MEMMTMMLVMRRGKMRRKPREIMRSSFLGPSLTSFLAFGPTASNENHGNEISKMCFVGHFIVP